MHTLPRGAKQKQKWTTFARIHRLACQRNTLPCAPSILKHRVSAEVCLLGHQWISRGFTNTINTCEAKRFYWTLNTQEMREDLQIDFFLRNVLWTFLWDPFFATENRQYPKFPPCPPPHPIKINFFSDWVGLLEICFRFSEMTDPRSCPRPRGCDHFRVPSRSTKTCHCKLKPTTYINCKNRYFLGIRETSQGKTPPSPNVEGLFSGQNRFVLSLP